MASCGLSRSLQSHFLHAPSITAHRLYSCDQGLLKVQRTNYKTFGDRAFAHSGPFLGNKLLIEIQSSSNVAVQDTPLQASLQFVLMFLIFYRSLFNCFQYVMNITILESASEYFL